MAAGGGSTGPKRITDLPACSRCRAPRSRIWAAGSFEEAVKSNSCRGVGDGTRGSTARRRRPAPDRRLQRPAAARPPVKVRSPSALRRMRDRQFTGGPFAPNGGQTAAARRGRGTAHLQADVLRDGRCTSGGLSAGGWRLAGPLAGAGLLRGRRRGIMVRSAQFRWASEAAGGVRSRVWCGGRSCTSRSCARLSSSGQDDEPLVAFRCETMRRVSQRRSRAQLTRSPA